MKHRWCTFFQALCQGPEGRSLNSFGRRRRRRRSETFRQGRELNEDISLREMFRVYETREEIPATLTSRRNKIGGTSSPKFCLNSTEYYGLVTTFLVRRKKFVKLKVCWHSSPFNLTNYFLTLLCSLGVIPIYIYLFVKISSVPDSGFYGAFRHYGGWPMLPQSSSIFQQNLWQFSHCISIGHPSPTISTGFATWW